MRKHITITTSGIYVVDAVGAVTAKLVAGSVVALPEPAADRLIERGVAVEVVEEGLEEASPRSRRRAKAAAAVEETPAAVELEGDDTPAGGDAAEPTE